MKIIKNAEITKKYITEAKVSHIFKTNHLDSIELQVFQPGESIYFSEDKYKYLHILVSGKAKVYILNNNGDYMLLDFVKLLDFMGDIEFTLNKKNIYYNVKAITECLLIAIPVLRLKEITYSEELYKCLSEKIASKLLVTSKRYANSILYSFKERLISCLIEMSDGNEVNNVNTKEISDYLGVSSRHIRRILNELYSENLLEKNKDSLIILNKEKLYSYYIEN